MVDLQKTTSNSTNWRTVIRANRSKTNRVIFLFIAIYVLLGLLIDIALYYEGSYAIHESEPSIAYIIAQLLTFQTTPYATLGMLAVALVCIYITFSAHDKVMLSGTHHHEIIHDKQYSFEDTQILNLVEEMRISAGMRYRPRIFIIHTDVMNAFASGYSEKSAMIALTKGIINRLNREELQAVIAHELSHIQHLDIKLTLFVSVLSNIMLILIDLVFRGAIYTPRRKGKNLVIVAIIVLRFLLPLLTLILSRYLSRTREYMADAGAVKLTRSNEPLANALLKIHQNHITDKNISSSHYNQTANEQVRRASYIYDPISSGFMKLSSIEGLLSTHPPLAKRLASLGFNIKK